MNRKFRKAPEGCFQNLPSYGEFLRDLSHVPQPAQPLAHAADVYAVYTWLCVKERHPRLVPSADFFCLEADVANAQGAAGGAAAAPVLFGTVSTPPPTARRGVVVPVKSKDVTLTVDQLRSVFHATAPAGVDQLSLAVVDEESNVTLLRVFAHIQAPAEGPGS